MCYECEIACCRANASGYFMAEKIFTSAELYEAWPVLSLEERVEGFEFLKRDDADDFFCN